MSQKIIAIAILLALFLTACTGAATESPAADTHATEVVIPTPIPELSDGLPSLEILSGMADTCINAESYANVMSFVAMYDEMTTENHIEFRLLDSRSNVLTEDSVPGENKNSEENWGFYPLAYEVDANSVLVLELQVYESGAEGALQTSNASLVYNCTTGQTINSTFVRSPVSE